MSNNSDVLSVLGWGLRKYAWIVVVSILTVGVLVPTVLQQVPDQFEARSQVGPTRPLNLPNIDVLPRIGESVFENVATAQPVKNAAGLPDVDAVPAERVELVAAQDNVIFTVVGRASSPQAAKNIADVAASQFAQEINNYTNLVGSYAVQHLAVPPAEPLPKVGGAMAWGVGLLSGLLAGVGIVALVLLLRRPVVDPHGAEAVAGAPVLGRLILPGRRGGGIQGMTQLCRRILSTPTNILLLVGPSSTVRDRRGLSTELHRWLGKVRKVITLGSDDGEVAEHAARFLPSSSPPEGEELVIIADASPVEVATRPDNSLVLLVVREGTSQPTMRALSEQYLDGGGAMVLVRRPSWWHRPRRREPRSRRPGPGGLSEPWSPITNGDESSRGRSEEGRVLDPG